MAATPAAGQQSNSIAPNKTADDRLLANVRELSASFNEQMFQHTMEQQPGRLPGGEGQRNQGRIEAFARERGLDPETVTNEDVQRFHGQQELWEAATSRGLEPATTTWDSIEAFDTHQRHEQRVLKDAATVRGLDPQTTTWKEIQAFDNPGAESGDPAGTSPETE